MNIKNKVNPDTNHFLCHKCNTDAGAVPMLRRGYVYCSKCYKEVK